MITDEMVEIALGVTIVAHADEDVGVSGHTPGPWSVEGDDKNGQAVVGSEHFEVATCWHHCVGSIEQEMRHNARLIAAAPELLDALTEAEEFVNRHSEPWYTSGQALLSEIRAAIAKATQP